MPKTDTSRLYADHPHLAKINETWGTRACRELLNKLMNDSRGGGRTGFAPENASTIMRLLMEHDGQFPDLEDTTSMSWWQSEQERRHVRN